MTWHCTCQYSKDQYFSYSSFYFLSYYHVYGIFAKCKSKNVLFFLLFPIYIGLVEKEGVVKDVVEIKEEKSHHLSL